MTKATTIFVAMVLTCFLSTQTIADIVVDTLPANNQANLNADAGQTFTTGALTLKGLGTIEIEGPQSGASGTVFGLELWTDTDQNHSTWDPGTLLATATNTSAFSNGTITTFNFSGEALADNTVYGFTYTDGAGNRILARMGLTNANAISNGTLFGGGSQQFGDAFDTAMRITTIRAIPEPSSIALIGVGLLGLVVRRRRS